MIAAGIGAAVALTAIGADCGTSRRPAPPSIAAERVNDRAVVRYTVPTTSGAAPDVLLLTADSTRDDRPPATIAVQVSQKREGTQVIPLRLDRSTEYRVSASVLTEKGKHRSEVTSVPLK